MRAPRYTPLLLLVSSLALGANAQNASTSLQVGVPIERTLAAGQTHSFAINLEQGQFLQIVVDQRGIDVIVRVYAPSGRRLGEFDTPNGSEGPENVTVVSTEAGIYRIEVAPLSEFEKPPPGRYEIKITELRKATEQELLAGKNQDQLKAKALDLVVEAAQSFPDVRRPETRAGFQIKAAQILWESDEKRAAKLMQQAMDSVREFIAGLETGERDPYEGNQISMQLRQQLIEVLAPHDPEMALNFLRSTRTLPNLPGALPGQQTKQELQLECSLVSQIANSDPKHAFQMAEDALKDGVSTGMINLLQRLRSGDQQLAAQLTHDIAAKLETERLLNNYEAGYLAAGLLRVARSPRRLPAGGGETADKDLLSDDDFRDLFQKVVGEVLTFTPQAQSSYSPERDVAQNLANALKQMPTELQSYAPDKAAALDEKFLAIQNSGDPQRDWSKYQRAINDNPTDATESINQAPPEMKDSLYQQLANRLAQTGDSSGARQIINEHIANPMQRRQALKNLDQQSIYTAVNKGKIDEALRILTDYRPVSDRTPIIAQIVTQIGPGLKRAAAISYLDQMRGMLDEPARVADQQQMFALLQLGRAFVRYDIGKALEIIDPLMDRFNDISSAAQVMNGFGQKYYQEGELIMTNGNAVGETANRMAATLAGLAMANFERAKTAAERVRPLDVRLFIYMTIAQQTTRDARGGVVDY